MKSHQSNPLSVIVPAYNEEKNIIKILKQFEQQTISDFEVVIVDDGSIDNTVHLAKNFHSENFKINLLQQSNMGAARARENGIMAATGDYVAIVDCDDGLANNSLELAMQSFINCPEVDISLFDLCYVNELGSEISGKFSYYTDKKSVCGKDALANSISIWGIHAFGIYKKEIILQAYNIYNKYNNNHVNLLNNDEIVSRISFGLAKKITFSDAKYFFVNNMQSTTRRVNENYYKVIHNAFILQQILKEPKICCEDKFDAAAYTLIISTQWGVFRRYLSWHKQFSKDARIAWRNALKESTLQVINAQRKYEFILSRKSRLQLIILKLFFR
ncbi:glycosyltransferase family 2 protein [Enterobacter sp. Ap-916]|uniref:glycosyltransferase n=1 Tax=Enterobacteriaceae TaxID=543 RepID=UPI00141D7523|nr:MULTISPECIES: glycosyltransferase family A protein [unclassified Enterobacter]NIF57285.1 glycosyltransferase family 2 protein [Enterobacter sp. Ap-867]NIG28774.1 glycosyltransferase family 2 protein [Enterobacter sp. Ap-916]